MTLEEPLGTEVFIMPANTDPYDFTNSMVKGGFDAQQDNPNGMKWDKIMALNDAYKSQYGTNITPDALMRNYNEAAGNYLWGPPSSGSAPVGSTVADPTASIATPNGSYQNGTFTPTAAAAAQGIQSVTNPIVNAPDISQVDPWETVKRSLPGGGSVDNIDSGGLAQALTNLTNIQNGTGPNGSQTTGTNPTGAIGGAAGILKQIQDYLAKIQNPYDILQQREQALGIPGMQQNVSGLRQSITNTTNLLNQVAPGVQGRVANSLVTAAQANRQIQNEQAPIQANLQNLGVQAGDAQNSLNDLMSQANSEAQMQSQGQQQSLTNLQNLYQSTFGAEQAQQQMAEQQREFNVNQAKDKYQFEKNLTLETKKYDLSVEAQAEARRQFDAQQALDQQKFQHDQFWAGVNHADALNQQNIDNQQKQQQLDEAKRSNLASESNSRASTTAKADKAPTAAENKQADMGGLAQYMQSRDGKDGHVSQETWNDAINKWTAAGYSAKEFVTQNVRFVNQRYGGYHGYN